jgi:hypothetical protein
MALMETKETAREVTLYTQLTGLNTAKDVPTPGTMVMIQAEVKSVRYRMDGTNPTAAVGFLLAAGETHILNLTTATSLKVIETAASAKLNVHVFK